MKIVKIEIFQEQVLPEPPIVVSPFNVIPITTGEQFSIFVQTIPFPVNFRLLNFLNETGNKGSIWSTYDYVSIGSSLPSTTFAWPTTISLISSQNPIATASQILSVACWEITNTSTNKAYVYYNVDELTFTPTTTGIYTVSVSGIDENRDLITFNQIPSITAVQLTDISIAQSIGEFNGVFNEEGLYQVAYEVYNESGENRYCLTLSAIHPPPSPTPSVTPTSTTTPTPTVTPSLIPSSTPTPTPTLTVTPGLSPTPTSTPTPTLTPTVTPTLTPTPTQTPPPTIWVVPNATPRWICETPVCDPVVDGDIIIKTTPRLEPPCPEPEPDCPCDN